MSSSCGFYRPRPRRPVAHVPQMSPWQCCTPSPSGQSNCRWKWEDTQDASRNGCHSRCHPFPAQVERLFGHRAARRTLGARLVFFTSSPNFCSSEYRACHCRTRRSITSADSNRKIQFCPAARISPMDIRVPLTAESGRDLWLDADLLNKTRKHMRASNL